MADVSIDGTIHTDTARGLRSVVFTTTLIGYWFYIDSDGTFGYCKTTDGGASWGGQVEIASAVNHRFYDVWFDQWTPGDSGTLIHTWYTDVTNDDITWRSLDTNGDTLATAVQVVSLASAVGGRNSFISGTKTRSGYLYVISTIDAGAEDTFRRSTDAGATWSTELDATFMEASADQCILFPASNTGDNNDCWAVYQDASTDQLTLKMWDSSAASASESSSCLSLVENTTDLIGQYGFSGSVRHSDGHLIVTAILNRDAGAASHTVWDINGTASITALTSIEASTDDHYHPQVFIDQLTNDIYVAYNGKRDGSETLDTTTKVYYTKSTDDGTTWSAGDTAYMEDAAGVVAQVWTPLMGPRFYAGWRIGSTLLGGFTNSIVVAASAALTGTITAAVTEADIVAGGKTAIITLTNNTWKAAGTGPIGSTADTQAIIDGIDSAQSEAAGWNAVVQPGIETTDVVRTSDTVATITLDAEATYDITATETITVTVPSTAISLGGALVATPTFNITHTSADTLKGLCLTGVGT